MDDAADSYGQAAARWSALGEDEQQIDALLAQAAMYEEYGSLDTAVDAYAIIQALYESQGDMAAAAELQERLGKLYRDREEFADAADAFAGAAELWSNAEDEERRADALTLQRQMLQRYDAIINPRPAAAAQPRGNSAAIAQREAAAAQRQAERQAAQAERDLRAEWTALNRADRYAEAIALSGQPNGITSPAPGERLTGVISIEGVAQHPEYRKLQLDLLIDGDENQVAHLGIRGSPAWGTLLPMDTQVYPTGAHSLRLRVVRQDGNYQEYFVPVVIDNPSTQIGSGITWPSEGATISRNVQVFGIADHPEFRKWQLDLLLFKDAGQATFLDVDDKPAFGRMTVFRSHDYPNGTHQLRLRVVHSNMQYDEYFTTITIAN